MQGKQSYNFTFVTEFFTLCKFVYYSKLATTIAAQYAMTSVSKWW